MDCACVARRGSGIMASCNRFGRRRRLVEMFLFLSLVAVSSALQAAKVSPLIEKVSDHKDFKKLLRTRTNVLVLYTKSASSGGAHLKLLSDVAQAVKGQGTIAWVNCGDSEGRNSVKKSRDGTFHTEYNRPATFK
ncbi:protein disulfide-isomerase A5-like, partial [Carassius auratus]|uniref:Protein disulfide-isomerase A5-like n=1 Tax=Carassius auratus TaxID=7957 RepID=A0A6P6MPN9_CARAU